MAKTKDIERLRRQIEVFNPGSDDVNELKHYLLEVMELLWKREK